MIVFKVVRDTAYLKVAGPEGSVRLSLQPPTKPPTCDINKDVPCSLDITPLDQLSYCNQSLIAAPSKYPCVIWDAQVHRTAASRTARAAHGRAFPESRI